MNSLGIDEAGRGPVIGPLVVAGVHLKKEHEPQLKDLGITDSKLLSPKKRENLEKEIKKIAINVRVIIISAKQIDNDMKNMSLNHIEMNAMAKIINQTPDAKKTIIDLPSNSKTFTQELEAKTTTKTKITAEFKADLNHTSVSAASIIAKTERDRQIRLIEKKHNIKLGSGYPSDPKTKTFLKEYIPSHDTLPDYIRQSWQTTKDLIKQKTQKGLGDF
ncbi:MAG: ribonuclease HII [Candidatus Aenigmarchaeota archaeon]|nr:ribonuclease HII [Candidatus Aenigmarchaeota archaeon]